MEIVGIAFCVGRHMLLLLFFLVHKFLLFHVVFLFVCQTRSRRPHATCVIFIRTTCFPNSIDSWSSPEALPMLFAGDPWRFLRVVSHLIERVSGMWCQLNNQKRNYTHTHWTWRNSWRIAHQNQLVKLHTMASEQSGNGVFWCDDENRNSHVFSNGENKRENQNTYIGWGDVVSNSIHWPPFFIPVLLYKVDVFFCILLVGQSIRRCLIHWPMVSFISFYQNELKPSRYRWSTFFLSSTCDIGKTKSIPNSS